MVKKDLEQNRNDIYYKIYRPLLKEYLYDNKSPHFTSRVHFFIKSQVINNSIN